MIPKDPVMLLSYLNTQLRDNYENIEKLAEGLDLSDPALEEILKKLSDIGYKYDADSNQFR